MFDETEKSSGQTDQCDGSLADLPGTSLSDQITLLKNGYEPLPIRHMTKRPGYLSWTKVEITEDWLGHIRLTNPDHTSTGLRTGRLVGVDIDLIDGDHATILIETVQQHLGRSVYWRKGSKGMMLCYRNETPISKIAVKGRTSPEAEIKTLIEVLGDGQQLVAYGVHPSGCRYNWLGDFDGCDPLGTALDCLPEVTPDQIRTMVAAVSEKLRELGYHDVHASESGIATEQEPSKGAATGRPITKKILTAMFDHLDPDCSRDEWRNLAAGLKSANVVSENGELDQDFDGFEFFQAWSSKGGKYKSTANCLELWNSLKPKGKKPSGIGFGTVIFLARRGGYRGPTMCPVVLFGDVAVPAGAPNSLTEINNRYAMVETGPNASKIVDLTDPRSPRFMDVRALATIYANKSIVKLNDVGQLTKINPVTAWVASSARRGIKGIVFEPSGSPHPIPEGSHNTWQGPVIEPIDGEAHWPFMQHLRNHVCNRDQALFAWLQASLAHLIQEPGNKQGTAVVLRGKQGAGKTIVFDYLEPIFGPHAVKVSKSVHLTGRFNSHQKSIVLLGVEEAFWAGDKNAEGVLKDLITSQQLMVEQKYADPYKQSNHVHLLVTSNEEWVVPVGLGDRRWVVLDVNDEVAHGKPGHDEYWTPIIRALQDGTGPACLLHYLKQVKYDRALLTRPPMTQAKAEQACYSLDPHEKWWLEVLKGEERVLAVETWLWAGIATRTKTVSSAADDVFGTEVLKDTVYDKYVQWHQKQIKHGRLIAKSEFWKWLRVISRSELEEARPSDANGERKRIVRFPLRAHCQAAFAEALHCTWADLDGS